MKIKKLSVGPLEVNCYIVWDEETLECAVIDPGGNAETIKTVIETEALTVKHLINTHGHFDHIGANGAVKELFDAPLSIHEHDASILGRAAAHAATFGLTIDDSPPPDTLLTGRSVIEVGSLKFEVIHTPGHTEGGVCLYLRDEGVLFTGDTLFAGSIGRTDLPGGSYDQIMRSIKERILTLPGSTRVLPGHEGESTIADEKRSNPYLRELA